MIGGDKYRWALRCLTHRLRQKERCPDATTGIDGFTLLEILVALIILGLGVAMLTGSITDSLARTQRIKTENQAATLADGILARLGQDIPLRQGIVQGRDQNLAWTLVVAPLPGGSAIVPLDCVDLTVRGATNHVIGHWQTLRVASIPLP